MVSFLKTLGRGGLVVAGVGVIEINGVRIGTPPKRDTCHGLRLCLWYGDNDVCLVVEETQAE